MARRISSKPLDRELGFGKSIALEGRRLMNPDGSFNVRRQPATRWTNLYHYLITIRWWQFFGWMICTFFTLNLLFASIYVLVGVEHLAGIQKGSLPNNFLEAYFFSSQTLTTVGYGRVSPQGLPANLIASMESFAGLLAFALVSGLMYGRFSRPKARIIFSENMLVSPYLEGQALMFRMTNARKSELIETEVQMIVSINQTTEDGVTDRRFYPLNLQFSKISFFSLSWTVVHPLDETSPLYGFTAADMRAGAPEILVLVKGTDETHQQMVHTRRSYVAEEIQWNARFKPVIAHTGNGVPYVLTHRIGEYEEVSV